MKKFLCKLFFLIYPLTGIPAEDTNINPELSNLLQQIERTRQELDIPAVALTLVDKNNLIWSGVFGIADRKTQTPATTDTVFRIGSITKSFTALAILVLVQQKKLALDDKLVEIAPELKLENPWYRTHPVRIVHLLEHTSGLNDLTRKEFDLNEPLSLREALQLSPESRVVQWPPGTHYSYTNAGAGLLSYVIEKYSGQSYEDFVTEHIFVPLGMSSASFFPDEQTVAHLATGYDTDGNSIIPYWHMIFRAFGAINLKPKDMSSFLQLLLNKGTYKNREIFQASLIDRMQTPRTSLAAQDGLAYGYGLGMYSFLRDGHLFYGHGGDGDGYLARYGINRETETGYFIVINVFRGQDLVKIRRLVEVYLLRDLPEPEKKSMHLSNTALLKFTGEYAVATRRFPQSRNEYDQTGYIEIQLRESGLFWLQPDRKPRQLIAVTKNHFRFTDEPVATMAFVVDEDNNFYLQCEEGNYQKIK
jgi:CubicO group peptidase (beta-lactamase class C family)